MRGGGQPVAGQAGGRRRRRRILVIMTSQSNRNINNAFFLHGRIDRHFHLQFQRSSKMRLGTAFATTVAMAAAPRRVSADGNSISSKLQVHVSTPRIA